MKRREFIAGLAGTAAWPAELRALQGDRMRRVGVLMLSAETDSQGQFWLKSFVQVLRNLGWVTGKNIIIDVRWNEGDAQRARGDAAELIGLSPDVIFAPSTANLTEAIRATQTIPIVFAQVSDPVA